MAISYHLTRRNNSLFSKPSRSPRNAPIRNGEIGAFDPFDNVSTAVADHWQLANCPDASYGLIAIAKN